jgi:hypothetical protein
LIPCFAEWTRKENDETLANSITQSTQQSGVEEKEQRERTPSPSQKIKTQSESQKSTATNRVLKPPPSSQEAYQKEKEMKKGVHIEEPSLATTSCLKINMTSALSKATSALCKAVDILCLEKAHKIDDLSSLQSC